MAAMPNKYLVGRVRKMTGKTILDLERSKVGSFFCSPNFHMRRFIAILCHLGNDLQERQSGSTTALVAQFLDIHVYF